NYASFSPNGDFILSASADQKACIWTAKDGQLVAVLLHGSYLNYATFSPDGRQVVTAGRDGMARVWDRASRELVTLLKHEGPVQNVVFTPSGRVCTVSYLSPVVNYPALLPGIDPESSGDFPESARDIRGERRLETRVWDVSKCGRPAEKLRHFSELMSGRRYD